MATIGGGALTLLDWAKRTDPDGNTATVVELLNQTNEPLTDMLWIEGNLPTGNQTTIRTGLPSATFRKLYGGVQPAKSTTAQITDATCMIEMRSQPDAALVKLNGNTAAFRLSESMPCFEGMNQTFMTALFAGDTTVNPEQFMGLRLRYPSLTGAASQNVITAGGSTNLTEIWLVGWGDQTIAGIFPKGSTAGIVHEDLGLIDAFDGQTPPAPYRAYADRYAWDAGLMVKDWRFAVRIPNIDTVALAAQTGTQAVTAGTWFVHLMSDALERIPSLGMCKPVFYCNRTVRANLRKHALTKSAAAMGIEAGLKQIDVSFLGVPVHISDKITNAVTAVS
jgi:hypothetical protein